MTPAASVSGLYFAHPRARYFTVGRLGEDQIAGYARRKGQSIDEVERWLTPQSRLRARALLITSMHVCSRLCRLSRFRAQHYVHDNTIVQVNALGSIQIDGPPVLQFVYTNNLSKHGSYGIAGSGHGSGMSAISAYLLART